MQLTEVDIKNMFRRLVMIGDEWDIHETYLPKSDTFMITFNIKNKTRRLRFVFGVPPRVYLNGSDLDLLESLNEIDERRSIRVRCKLIMKDSTESKMGMWAFRSYPITRLDNLYDWMRDVCSAWPHNIGYNGYNKRSFGLGTVKRIV